MKKVRVWAGLLAAVLALGLAAGCRGGSGGSAVTEPAASGPEEPVRGCFDFERALRLGLAPEEWRARAGEQITGAQFRAALEGLVGRFRPEQTAYFEENVTDLDIPLTRGMGFIMAYYAAKCVGADTYNNDFDNNRVDTDELWSAAPDQFRDLLPHCGDGPEDCGGMTWNDVFTAAYLFSFWHSSPLSGELLFDFDGETGSMRQGEALTVEDAGACLARLYDSVPVFAPLDDARVTEPDGALLAPEHIAEALALPEVTSDSHPVWTGFVFGSEYRTTFNVFPQQLEKSAAFGFNSARIKVNFEALFNGDVTESDVTALHALDNMVRTAIENGLHLNICLVTLPGRTTSFDEQTYTSQGEFDLFIDPEKQALADRVWTVLARRYREVPSASLSFTPFWEALNRNLSSGLPYEEYGPEDVGRYLAHVIGVIRAEDPDRLVIYEPTANNPLEEIRREASAVLSAAGPLENAIISYNYCQHAYVYAGMNATEGSNIDVNNHSMFLPDYPNTIYSVNVNIYDNFPLTFDGTLPAGTVVDIYLRHAFGGSLEVLADGRSLWREVLEDKEYRCGEMVSGFYPFAESEKKISVTLPEDTDELVISCANGGVQISGVDLLLPEAYAVERWYYATGYDAFLGAETEAGVRRVKTSRVMVCPNAWESEPTRVTVHDDLSYTTQYVTAQANADEAAAWGDGIAALDGNCVVRFESACFSGTTWESMAAYYEDILSMCAEHGFSWWSNDWYNICSGSTVPIAGASLVRFDDYPAFNMELLELLQKYQAR